MTLRGVARLLSKGIVQQGIVSSMDHEAIEVVLSCILHKFACRSLADTSPEFYQLIGLELVAKAEALGIERLKGALDCVAVEIDAMRELWLCGF